MTAWWSAVNQDAADNDAFEKLNTKRQATFTYRGRSVEITVHSWQHELEIMLACVLKSSLIPKCLVPVTIEDGLLNYEPEEPITAEADILLPYANARELCNAMIPGQPQVERVLIDLLRREIQACLPYPLPQPSCYIWGRVDVDAPQNLSGTPKMSNRKILGFWNSPVLFFFFEKHKKIIGTRSTTRKKKLESRLTPEKKFLQSEARNSDGILGKTSPPANLPLDLRLWWMWTLPSLLRLQYLRAFPVAKWH